MFRDNSNKNLKYAIRKKKNGGGAASFIIGSVVLGGMMVSGLSPVKADTTDATANPDSTTDTSSTASSSATDSNEVALSNPSASTTATTASSEDTAITTTTPTSNETATSTASTASAAQPTAAANSTSTAPTTDAGTTSTTDVPASERGKATAKYVDEKGQVVATKNITGYVGSYVDVATSLPAGYVLDDKDQTAANGKLAETPTELTVYVTAASNKRTGAQSASTPADAESYPLSDGTVEGMIKKADSMTKDQYVNNKVTISNIAFGKDKVIESEGTDLNINFDWEGTGIKKGDILVTRMTDAFTSSERKPVFDIDAGGIKGLAKMLLDYDNQRIITEFRKTMDPTKIYSGTINVGTFIDRNKFPYLENDATFNIPTPNGDVVTKKLKVIFDRAQEYDKVYVDALSIKHSDDKTQADVKWGILVNPTGKNNMGTAAIYITPDIINTTNPTFDYDGSLLQTNVDYTKAANPFILDEDSIEVYEVTSTASLGYTHGKKLEKGKDYEVRHGSYDYKTDSQNMDVWIVNFIGDYAVTNKQFSVEFNAHYNNLDPEVEKGDRDAGDRASVTGVTVDTLLSYTNTDPRSGKPVYVYDPNFGGRRVDFTGDIVSGSVSVINSNLTVDDAKDYTGSVIVVHLDADTMKPLKLEAYAVDADGKTIQNVPVGTEYKTTPEYFEGYKYLTMGYGTDDASGEVIKGTKKVIYLYKRVVEQKGSVDVTYKTKDGKILEATTDVAKDVKVGTDYTTEEKSFPGYHFVGMDKTSDPAMGVVAEGTKHVIYLYEPDTTPEVKKGSVDVTYVTENGTVLKATTDVVKDGDIGTAYDTTKEPFDGYHFVRMGDFSADASGKVTEGTQHVVYVYAANPVEKKGSVDVKYVDQEGNILPGGDLTTVKDNRPVGEDYTTEEKPFEGYHFVGMDKNSDPATGVVSEGTKHVVYVYEKDPEVKCGTVTVTYVDKNGNPLPGGEKTTVKDNVPVGEDYTTEEKDFPGYRFDGMDKNSDPANGKVTEGTKNVVYVYEKDPEVKRGTVTVTYVDKDGNPLPGGEKTTVKDNVPVGEDYTTEEKDFPGYHFVGMDKTSDSTNGKVTEGTKNVVYVYEKDPEVKRGTVTVTYVDKNGNPLPGGEKTTVKDNVPVGEDYTTEEKDFPGYHFVGMDKNSSSVSGKVTEETKNVIYVYEPNGETLIDHNEEKQGSVDVKYVTTDGTVLKDTEKVKDGEVGTDYETSQLDFDGYKLVGLSHDSAAATGKLVEGELHVVYVYEKLPTVANDKNEEKRGSVDVSYVDKDGNLLEGPNVVVKDGKVGSGYQTNPKEFNGYKLVGLLKDSAAANGEVIDGNLHVIYVYEKVSAPTTPATATSEVPTPTPVQPSVVSHTTPSPAKVNVEKQALPQTGEEKNTNASALGVIALGLAGLFGLGAAKKKEEKDN
ncbi:MucBP domain-containing protein [Ligilactobacillus agilis]|nr:MucBP domain-containing protein [Ligilactobacillus agilis]